MRNLALVFVLGAGAALLLPALGIAGSRSGFDLGSRVAALEAQQAVNTGQIAANSAAITAHVNDTGNAHGHDARYVRDSGPDTRSFWGVIDGAGTVLGGGGFTAVRNSTGNYTITYATPFPSTPSVQAFAGHGGMTFNVGTTSVDILVFDNAANPFDSAFMIWVAGPQ